MPNPKDDFIATVRDLVEDAGLATYTVEEMERVESIVPDADMSTVLRVQTLEPGEGPVVVAVKDSAGKTHRVCLTPH
ncbi:MAG: hypothetical protein O2794_00540 [bacterium]|nr:hypothetical protein [bacterium]